MWLRGCSRNSLLCSADQYMRMEVVMWRVAGYMFARTSSDLYWVGRNAGSRLQASWRGWPDGCSIVVGSRYCGWFDRK